MKIALESTVITHGMPYPQNVETALHLEKIARDAGATPLTIGILDGEVRIGLTENEIERLATADGVIKAGVRELPLVIAQKKCASTTVSATARLALWHGIHVFATGGIGGVHQNPQDVSMDLAELTRTPIVVVSAGPKSILNLPATNELLETLGVTVVGYRTDEMPAFYERSCGLPVMRADDPAEIAEMLWQTRRLGLTNAILVFNPIPVEDEISHKDFEHWLKLANQDLALSGITGKLVTPYVLQRLVYHSGGRTVHANQSLLENNVRLGVEIGFEFERLNQPERRRSI